MEEAKPVQEGEHKQSRMLETSMDQKQFPIHHSLAWAYFQCLRRNCHGDVVLHLSKLSGVFCNGLRREEDTS